MKKEKDTIDKCFEAFFVIVAVAALICLGLAIGAVSINVALDQETADDVCQQLTGNSTAVASGDDYEGFSGGKLICTIPSLDSTQNIIIKKNSE